MNTRQAGKVKAIKNVQFEYSLTNYKFFPGSWTWARAPHSNSIYTIFRLVAKSFNSSGEIKIEPFELGMR